MNNEIKEMIKKAGLHQWQVAKRLGITAGKQTPMISYRRKRNCIR